MAISETKTFLVLPYPGYHGKEAVVCLIMAS